jgi:elongation factor P
MEEFPRRLEGSTTASLLAAAASGRLKDPEAKMVSASQLRPGMVVRYENNTYRVVAAEYHPGQGKMGGATHARLKNLSTGTFWEHSFRSELKLEEVASDTRAMDFLYRDGDHCYFMDPDTYEQIAIPESMVGPQAVFLLPEMRLNIDQVEGKPVGVQFPEMMEVRIADTAPPIHQQDSTWKPARLENGMEIMVPQFIKTGDLVRLDVVNLKYMDRAKGRTK